MSDLLDKIKEYFIWLYEYVLDSIFNGIISILSYIPVPSFLTDMVSNASGISGMAAYYLGVFNVGLGVQIILGAYLIRFAIRRIPIIG